MSTILREENLDVPEKRKRYTVCVVGCGRIGLPTACLFAEAGFRVIGADVNARTVALLNKGKAPLSEAGLAELLKKHVKNGRFTATKDIREAASTSDIIVLAVPTPVDLKKKPDYTSIERPCKEIGRGLRAGSLVIVTSTAGPGTTETIIKETLEKTSGFKAGVDFGLAYSPTRAAPGRVLQDVATHARVLGAINEKSLKAASLVLGTIVKGGIVKVRDMKTTEAVQLFENIHRDVNLALANEFAQFCEKIGIDYFEAQKAANTQSNCHLPAPRIVSGQVSKDPYLLLEEAENVNAKLRMVLLARKINDEMPVHAIRLVKDALKQCGKPLRRAKISILGVSHHPDAKESRSKTKELVRRLRAKGAVVQVYDPFYSQKELTEIGYNTKKTLTKTVEGTDCLLITVGHDRFKRLNLGKIKLLMKKKPAIVDMGHVIDPEKAEKKGFIYRGVGRGIWTK
ncbi:MAG: nucleotide sugar dehydrogenase [Candidatus Bathyarchaeia archaeon]